MGELFTDWQIARLAGDREAALKDEATLRTTLGDIGDLVRELQEMTLPELPDEAKRLINKIYTLARDG